MTINLEKIFFNYIIRHREYFNIVESYYFQQSTINFIYDILRNYIKTKPNVDIPSPKQLYDMVKIEDTEDNITIDIFKTLINIDFRDYDEENFIKPQFFAWITKNNTKLGLDIIIDKYRNSIADETNLEVIKETLTDIRNIVNEKCSTEFLSADDDLGSDFDDVENHVQDTSKYKVKSGLQCLDVMLGSGWDQASLNVLMAESNNGKSLWMQNLSVLCANGGYNVLYITLEMSERKVMKRLGAMRLSIPINEYDEKSKDSDYIKNRINKIKGLDKKDLFEKKDSKIFVKFWSASTITLEDIDNYIKKLQEVKNLKIDIIFVDYMQLISVGKNAGDSLYQKGKCIAEGLRAIAAKYNVPLISAVQVAKDAWNSREITMENVPESKAIVETSDNFFAIIRTKNMKKENKYIIRCLKQRDGDFVDKEILFELNPTYLTIKDVGFVDDSK